MKVAISGGTGMVGKRLTKLLTDNGYEVIILTRGEPRTEGNITYIEWMKNGATPEKHLEHLDAYINLAGVSLNEGRWTDEQKEKIYQSRMDTTDEVIRIFKALEHKPSVYINASAVGIYPVSETAVYTEQSTEKADDFLGSVVTDWEQKASEATELGIRTCLTRFGVILEHEAGALPSMVLPYRLGVGGTIGSGKQWLSWIHVEDVVRAMLYIIEHEELEGPINFTSPNVKRMKAFGKAIGKALNRPHWLPVPEIALELALGEKSILVVEGQHVVPEKLLNSNFTFKFVSAEEAIRNLYQ